MRRHARIRHRGWVECETGDGVYHGRGVDISSSGMRLELPDDVAPQSVRFTLPGSDRWLRIPVRPVRTVDSENERRVQTALEFDYHSELDRLQVMEFVREAFSGRNQPDAARDTRKLPRVDCRIVDVQCDRPGLQIECIDNISTDGLQLRFAGRLQADEALRLRFWFPGDRRPVSVETEVMHIQTERFAEFSVAGLGIVQIEEIDAARLRNFIVAQSSGTALRSVFERMAQRTEGADEDEYAVPPHEAETLLRSAAEQGVAVQLMLDRAGRVGHTELLAAGETLRMSRNGFGERDSAAPGAVAYAGLSVCGDSVFFRSTIRSIADDYLELEWPREIYRSEKRAAGREVRRDDRVHVRVEFDRLPGRTFTGRVLDLSRRGLRCTFYCDTFPSALLEVGAGLRFDVGEGPRHGELRHISVEAVSEGVSVTVGIETDVERGEPHIQAIDPETWEQLKSSGKTARLGAAAVSTPVTFHDAAGRPIRALINATREGCSAPVVVLPPAFGKKKEALAPLAAVLIATFVRHGQDLITIRYDGVDRPGESYSSVEAVQRGYDMLRFSISQSLEDLRATLRFIESTDLFTARGVVPVTFSMAALEGRKIALEPGVSVNILAWASVMGVAAGQPALVNTLGGIDPVGNFKLGVPNGICGLLGHLVDLDVIAEDLVEHGYAGRSDARADMAGIDIPVLWIYGEHDKWVTADDVIDIMSIAAPAERELVRVPAGHNLRTSDDAIATFSLIAEWLFAKVHRREVQAVRPEREELLEIVTRERERLERREDLNADTYWERYLIGAGDSGSGYDVYRNIGAFRAFLDRQVVLAAVKPGARVADIGCGTGLFLERLLVDLKDRMSDGPAVEVTAVDLVPKALESARRKAQAVLASTRGSPCNLSFRVADFEPSRFVPFMRLRDNPELGPEYLRDRVEGLTNAELDRLLAEARPQLEAALSGRSLRPDERAALEQRCGPVPLEIIEDLSLAAQVVRRPGNGQGRPARISGLHETDSEDLPFRRLRFGRGPVVRDPLFPPRSLDVIVASLFISYLFNPEYAVEELVSMLAPGGRLVISSMRPDSDISTIFTEYVAGLGAGSSGARGCNDDELGKAREMLNEAAALFELEEDGYFRFYTVEELAELVSRAGLDVEQAEPVLGEPPQAVVVVGVKP